MTDLERVYHALAVLKLWERGPYAAPSREPYLKRRVRALINHDRILTQRPLRTY